MNRETIEADMFAFFAALATDGVPLFKTATRKVKHWEDVASEDQPALFMRHRSEAANYRKGLPTLWKFGYDLFLYVNTDAQTDPDVLPSQLINPLIDAIDNALTPDDFSDNAVTLGGIVSHCAISGVIEIFEGHLGNEAVVIVPIEIFVDGN